MSDFISAYLFFGGMGSGAFLCAAIFQFVSSSNISAFRESRFLVTRIRRILALSFLSISLGCVCLLIDLGRPEQAFLLFLNPTPTYISVASFSLVILLLSTIAAIVIDANRKPTMQTVQTFFLAVGSACACYIMIYTGLLLALAGGVDLWNSPALVALFFASSCSEGLALANTVFGTSAACKSCARRWCVRSARVRIVSFCTELIFCGIHFSIVSGTPLGAACVGELLRGSLSAMFLGGFLFCGTIFPMMIEVFVSCKRSTDKRLSAVAALLAIVGGFFLRLAFIRGGVFFTLG